MKNIIVLENIRSAYNTGNIIRTADALGWDVMLSGFTPHPEDELKVAKTSLGGEETCNIKQFRNPIDSLKELRAKGYILIAAEKTKDCENLCDFKISDSKSQCIAIVMGNENTGVLQETLEYVDYIVHIPMQGIKESLNVGQAAAIMMWEFGKSQ